MVVVYVVIAGTHYQNQTLRVFQNLEDAVQFVTESAKGMRKESDWYWTDDLEFYQIQAQTVIK